MEDKIRSVLKAAYYWGMDNGSGRSDKNFNDFLETTIAKSLLDQNIINAMIVDIIAKGNIPILKMKDGLK